jgi:hypothetical protein
MKTKVWLIQLILLAAFMASCVIPGPPDVVVSLDAKPNSNVLMKGELFTKDMLNVTAVYNNGDNLQIPPTAWEGSEMPNTVELEKQFGWVQYGGIIAYFYIFIYAEGAPPPDYSGKPTIEIPLEG